MTWGRLTVRGGFLLLMAFLIYFDTTGLLFWVAAAAGAHELGHWTALRLAGGRVARWELSLRGICMEPASFPALSYGRELLATLAGPMASLMLAFPASWLAGQLGLADLYAFSGILLFQGGFNLLPARGLDGGQALSLLLRWRASDLSADRAVRLTTLLCALLLSAGGALAFSSSGYDFTILLAIGYAVISLLSAPAGDGAKARAD